MNVRSDLDTTGIFLNIFNNSKENCIIIMDKRGLISDANGAFYSKFGYSSSDVIGKYFDILFTEEDKEKGLPGKEIKKVIKTGSAEDHNYLVNKNGSKTWVSGESILVKNNSGDEFVIKVIQNIQKIKDLQVSLHNQYDFSENILMSINEAILVIDAKLNVYKVNQMFLTLFEWGDSVNSKINSTNFNLLKEPLFSKKLNNLIEKGQDDTFEIKYKDKVLLIKLNELKEDYNPKRFILLVVDITDKIHSEQKKDDIIAFVAHELRNPLSSITICNDLLGDSVRENNMEESLTLLKKEKQNLDRLKLLISELHEATKAGTGNLQFNKSKFNFKKIVYECIETEAYIHKNYKIECNTESDIELSGDSYRLGQVITNYLENAIKYSTSIRKIEVNYELKDKLLFFSVRDYGEGISDDQKEIIFERYYRSPKTKITEGLGIGLYLSKEIIEVHGGKVWVESTEGEGSVFYFSIPIS